MIRRILRETILLGTLEQYKMQMSLEQASSCTRKDEGELNAGLQGTGGLQVPLHVEGNK
jgi:hypothetical protein